MPKQKQLPKKNNQTLTKGVVVERHFEIDKTAINEESRTIELAFSSENPVRRFWGDEVLDHDPQSVRLARLNDGGAVLVNHDIDDHVGVVEVAGIENDRVGRATVRFSKSQRGEEIFQDVLDGIRTQVSVRYMIHNYKEEKRTGKPNLISITDWEPTEISIVSIPADPNVGVGRCLDATENPRGNDMPTDVEDVTEETRSEPTSTPEPKRVDRAPNPAQLSAARRSERERVNKITEMADQFNLGELARQAIEEDWTYEQFTQEGMEIVGERNNKARVDTEHDGEVDLSNNDIQQFSFLRLMEALDNPDDRAAQKRAAFELEVSDEAVRGFGDEFKARGSYIPESVLARSLVSGQQEQQRDLSAGAVSSGSELVANNLLAGSFIEVLRNSMHTLAAGVTVLPGLVGNATISRQTSGAVMSWIADEDGDASESEASFDQISLTPKDAACYTEVTRRLFQQSTPAIEGLVRSDLATAIGLGLDLAVLYGTGAGGQPTGIANSTGINILDLAAADPTYAELINIIRLMMDDNALLGSPQWFISPSGWEALSTTPKQGAGVEGNFILSNGRVAGYPYHSTNQMNEDEYIFGDFSQVLMGEWGGLELNVDPFTHSLKGKRRYVIFKTCDLAIRHPQAFVYAHDGIA